MMAVYHHPCGRREASSAAVKPYCRACDALFDQVEATFSYRDVLARTARKRPDGSPVWPLTDADVPSRVTPRAALGGVA